MPSKNVSLDTLPEEVMENIINYLDGTSLGNLVKTCKRWKHCIEEPKSYILKKWGLVCMSEMKQDFIIDILQNLYPRYWISGVICWKSVYKSWRQWKNLRCWTPNVDVIDKKTRNYISSVKFSGNWVFIGTRNEGVLEAVNYVTREKVLLHQCNSVQDIYMRCYACQKDAGGMILEGVEHDEVVMLLMRHYICFNLHTGEVNVRPKLRNFLTLKHFEGYEVSVVNENSPSRVCNLNVITNHKVVCQREEFAFTNVIQVWNGNILLLDYDQRPGRIGEFQVTDYNFKTVDHPLTYYKLDMFEYLLSSSRQHYHLGVFITISDSIMEINVNGQSHKYTMFSHLSCRIMSSLYHAGVLLLGSDTGVIYSYRVNSDEELLKLDFSQYDCYLDICSQPILALDLKETFDKPLIVAGSEQSIYIIKFD